MNIAIGVGLEHGGERFVVVDIRLNETADGKTLIISALDPQTAAQERQKAITLEQTGNSLIDLVKKVVDGGNIGGMMKGE